LTGITTDGAGPADQPAPITVLSVGNTIMGDDGVGPAILAQVMADRGHDPHITYVEGGVRGLLNLPDVQDAHWLILLDAIADPAPPGTILHLNGAELPHRLSSKKVSPHQVGLLDLLTSARLIGDEPDRVEVVGVVPDQVDLSLELSPAVAAAVPEAAKLVSSILDGWLAELE
jgi:hydrogenase maturation protease